LPIHTRAEFFSCSRRQAATYPARRAIAARPREAALNKKEYLQWAFEFGSLFISEIRKGAVSWMDENACLIGVQPAHETQSGPEDALNIEDIFRRFEQRRLAGDAILKADEMLKQNKLMAIGPDLLDALVGAPEDLDVLLVLGEIAIRRGEFRAGYDLLCKVHERKPEATRTLRHLGVASIAMGRPTEAVGYLKKVLQLAPGDRAAHTTLAKALWSADHRSETLEVIDRTLVRWPDFLPAVELRCQFGTEFEQSALNISSSWTRPIRMARVILRRWLRHSNQACKGAKSGLVLGGNAFLPQQRSTDRTAMRNPRSLPRQDLALRPIHKGA
jgi:tetratricopeptide (TPR) repeat protein